MEEERNKMNNPSGDVVANAAERARLLSTLFDTIKKANDFLSADELELALESLKLASMEIREKEEAERRRKQAEKEAREKAAEEAKRIAAIRKAAEIEAEKNRKHVEEVTCMDLPMDWRNSYEDDERAKVHYDSTADAFMYCLESFGEVDIEFIASITGKECKEVIADLKGSIYQNPLTWNECFYKGWETADNYLSGNLMYKYDTAKQANEKYRGYFIDNVKALEDLMRPDLSTDEIYVTLGSPWVPAEVIDEFILHLVGIEPVDGRYGWDGRQYLNEKYQVTHDETTGLWDIPHKNRFKAASLHGAYNNIIFSRYGTHRMDMLHILENILNMKTLAIYDPADDEGKIKIFNKDETVSVLEKQDMLIKEFQRWIWLDEERKIMLKEAYCERYGNTRRRVFDGSFLTFPGMDPSVTLFKHQKDAVARILMSKNTLLAHEVGSGKTYVMIAAGMELRRLGKSRKNLYVIPNNIISTWKKIYKEMYPNANLLVVDNSNFNCRKRSETLKRIAEEDFDGILMTYSCFDRLSLSDRYYMEKYRENLEKLTAASNRYMNNSKIKRRRENVEKMIEKLKESLSKNVVELPFDELGINTLFVDEAHNYKNVEIKTSITRVLGLGGGSDKGMGMMDKVHCIQRQNDGGRIVFATGTPITNSITDIFVMQKYLQDGELEFLGLHNFDAWAGMFARKTTEFEIDVDTNSYHLATRFAQFCNIPELVSILSSITDFHQNNKQEDIPQFDGYTDSVREGSEDFKEYLADISDRADDVRQKRVSRFDDNLLKITSDGRKAALDMRLIDEAYGLDPESKVFRCAENVYEVYRDTCSFKGTQLVFCDFSTPKKGFNLYQELKDLLVAMGIPENEVAFIHDADNDRKRLKLFKDVNNGDVRVLIGSTFKMGLGVNVQKRLKAIHHLDVPWRPADMVQREGRILRPGNMNEKVEIFRYITRGSFDAYSWQLLETKQRFISQLLSGEAMQREGGDVDSAVLNYAEVKALAVGDPRIKKRVEISNELDRFRILQQEVIKERYENRRELSGLPSKIEKQEKLIALIEKDLDFIKSDSPELENLDLKEKRDFREMVAKRIAELENKPYETVLGTYKGFEVVVPAGMMPHAVGTKKDIPWVILRRNSTYVIDLESDSGITVRFDNLIKVKTGGKDEKERISGIEKRLTDALSELAELETRRTVLQDSLENGSDYSDNIEKLKKQLDEIDAEMGVYVA